MAYQKIRKMDISNGPGVRVSVFFQGCAFHCEGCFNPTTWDFDGGNSFGEEQIKEILELCKEDHISGLSILGGEPLHPRNIKDSTLLAKMFKERYPEKTLWIWSGYTFEEYIHDKEILQYTDVIIDGRFEISLRNPKLKWKGSSNQRVIDVPKTLEKNEVVLYEEDALCEKEVLKLPKDGKIETFTYPYEKPSFQQAMI